MNLIAISQINASGMVKHNPTVTVSGEVSNMALAHKKSAKNEMKQLNRSIDQTVPEGGNSNFSIPV